MIEELKLENYRCFSEHTIPFSEKNVIVGENNAGKSTIIEALRLVSIITSRYKSINYNSAPNWLDLPSRERGIKPSLKEYNFNFQSVFHRYGNPPAKIIAKFTNGTQIIIYINNNEDVFALIKDNDGKIVKNRKQANNIVIPNILILPQISPLKFEEKKLTEDYIYKSTFSNLSSQHFRNQLLLYRDEFERFKSLVEDTWDGCKIVNLDKSSEAVQPVISLLVRDNDFVAEIGWMGHGLQMWIQIMWFLSFATEEDIVVLDEPDVYMHADLQRKIIKILDENDFLQTLTTTHSVEIISEVSPEHILIVDKEREESKFANSIPSVQKLIDGIGCLHNIQLTRFWKCKKCILVEGEDMDFLNHLHSRLFPHSETPFEIVPNMPIGGWSGLNYAIGTSLILQNSAGESVNTYCILDRDYYPEEKIKDTCEAGAKKELNLHIWNRKEIENYLVIPDVIVRIIERRANETVSINASEICEVIDSICDDLYDATFDNLSNEYRKFYRDKQEKGNTESRSFISEHWDSTENKLKLVSGKEVISKLSKWSQNKYNVSFSAGTIVREIKAEEIDSEIRYVIEAIEENTAFLNKL
ncbi:ATP-dependent nuclease [Methanohalophilus mahii]|uniref:ATP-dependent endonuclease of the OLD family n=1 Tax=Methanohalophilus mahii (strain ATCC 35705 / DSM 5219 / SLP) TaxID=547558 RepID=D5E7R7_METMS|nr:ATP-binding protein [Methanohalophilus mahii]ADE37205.1 ATP-dependent endonuclease of the OLD family [Methanohalophilus mahii DSM 5219]